MRVAVISDIHANFYALDAVLSAIDEDAVDAVWCLGDVVGYGPRPNRCCAVTRERASVCLAGNHDLGVIGRLDLAEFSPDAAAAARWSQDVLDDGEREWLDSLATSTEADRVGLYHGSPRDPVWEYVLTEEAAEAAFRASPARVILVGHSHVALALVHAHGALGGGLAPAGTEIDLARNRWLLNPGSVGQPRDGDPRAAYVVIDLERDRAWFRRVAYEIEETQVEMRERRLPAALAERLAHGM